MNVFQFSKKYRISMSFIIRFLKTSHIREGIHYTIKQCLHQRKINIIKPQVVFDIMADKSKSIRRKVNG